MYKINFVDRNSQSYDYCELSVLPHESLYSKLEDVLYIMAELVPNHRNWKRDLMECGKCLFTYHRYEFMTVEISGEHITVKDC